MAAGTMRLIAGAVMLLLSCGAQAATNSCGAPIDTRPKAPLPEAIATPSGDPLADKARAAALMAHGNERDDDGHPEEAIISYTTAMALGLVAEAQAERGVTYTTLGRYDEALADLDAVIAAQPKRGFAWASRGYVCFDLGRYDEAAQNFDQAASLLPTDSYYAIWGFLARTKAGQPDPARLRRADSLNRKAWPGPVVPLLLDEMTPEAVAAAAEAGNAQSACEGPFYVGEYYLAKGDRLNAIKWLEQSRPDSCHFVTEWREAGIELRRLGE